MRISAQRHAGRPQSIRRTYGAAEMCEREFFGLTLELNSFIFSMRIPGDGTAVPPLANSSPFPLPFSTLWHRSPHSYSICPSSSDSIRFPDEPMSAPVLEQRVSCHARVRGNDCSVFRRYD